MRENPGTGRHVLDKLNAVDVPSVGRSVWVMPKCFSMSQYAKSRPTAIQPARRGPSLADSARSTGWQLHRGRRSGPTTGPAGHHGGKNPATNRVAGPPANTPAA